MAQTCRFTADLWQWQAQGGWFFVTLTREASAVVRERPRPPRGFGSVRVRATIGGSSWETSVFPDSRSGSFLLPVKKEVRASEDVGEGDPVDLRLEILE